MDQKLKTGIPGLDEMFKGGIIKGSSVLVTGAPGTGKSIVGLQFIMQGVKQNEACVYITSEESAESLRNYAESLGLDIKPYEKKNLLFVVEQPLTGKVVSLQAPLKIIEQHKVTRVVLDSLTLFEYAYFSSQNNFDFRKGVSQFIADMKAHDVTLMATSERSTADIDQMLFLPQDYLFEGLIVLNKVRKGASFERVISIAKMRGQEHMLDIFPLKIEKGGIKVYTKQLPFSLIEKDGDLQHDR